MEQINGYEGHYEIHLNGSRVWSCYSEKYLRSNINSQGYRQVGLCRDGKRTNKTIHRLVAEYFIDNPDNLPCVDHIDGNKLNNNIQNLRWCTRSDNGHNQVTARGYNWHKRTDKWRAQIHVNNKKIHLGYFDDEADARQSYLEASAKYYPGVKQIV